MKKTLSLILALTLAMVLAVPAMAAEAKTYEDDYYEVTNVTEAVSAEDPYGPYSVTFYAVAPAKVTITKSVWDYEGSEDYNFVTYCNIEILADDNQYVNTTIDEFEGEKDVHRGENNVIAAGSYCVFQPGEYIVTIGGNWVKKDKVEANETGSSGVDVIASAGGNIWGGDFRLIVTAGDDQTASEQPTEPAAKPVVIPTNQNLTVDGEAKETEIYNIDGSNYFKLRDMAALLTGTDAQFSVAFDSERNTIVVKTGEAYALVGGELATGTDKSASAVASAQSVEVNGEAVELTAFNIGGNNFFKLRELGAALNFDVDYDDATATMIVKSK